MLTTLSALALFPPPLPLIQLSAAEQAALVSGFDDAAPLQSGGLYAAGKKYFTLEANARSIYGKQGVSRASSSSSASSEEALCPSPSSVCGGEGDGKEGFEGGKLAAEEGAWRKGEAREGGEGGKGKHRKKGEARKKTGAQPSPCVEAFLEAQERESRT
jgi:hypothetical protein